jgi:DHA1 family inner membrane transport protein
MLSLTLFARSFASFPMQHEQISDLPLITAPHGAGLANGPGHRRPAIGTGEFASMSILPVVANDLHATLPDMGHMISAYAWAWCSARR